VLPAPLLPPCTFPSSSGTPPPPSVASSLVLLNWVTGSKKACATRTRLYTGQLCAKSRCASPHHLPSCSAHPRVLLSSSRSAGQQHTTLLDMPQAACNKPTHDRRCSLLTPSRSQATSNASSMHVYTCGAHSTNTQLVQHSSCLAAQSSTENARAPTQAPCGWGTRRACCTTKTATATARCGADQRIAFSASTHCVQP
jgi:hypothetical protein